MPDKGNFYKIAFCGIGSIGQRHLKNTINILVQNKCSFQIDLVRSGVGGRIDVNLGKYISNQYSYEDTIPNDYDIIFITNPTSMHTESILKYMNSTKSMFVEKPITDKLDFDFSELPSELVCYVASPLRYMRVLQYVKNNIKCSDAYCVRAICSTYLPNWHPNQDYRKSYSAHRLLGGGVSIDLIHEWDYLTWLFGMPDEVKNIQRHISSLEIDTEDISVYIGTSKSKIFELHLDYFGRNEIRKLEVFMPDETIEVDINGGTICFENNGKIIELNELRDEYQTREIEHFFDIIGGQCKNDNDIRHAMKILKIARGL